MMERVPWQKLYVSLLLAVMVATSVLQKTYPDNVWVLVTLAVATELNRTSSMFGDSGR